MKTITEKAEMGFGMVVSGLKFSEKAEMGSGMVVSLVTQVVSV